MRVRIEAEKHALSSRALERVRVEIDGEGDRVAVRTRVDRGGTFFGRSGKVDYRITLPSRARLELETVNGTVEVDGVTGRMRVECVNGSVRIRRAAGEVTASTVNGAIRARYGPVEPGGRHRFSTTNGSIDVELPEKTGGRLEARTINGRVTCDLPLESREIGHVLAPLRVGLEPRRQPADALHGSAVGLPAGELPRPAPRIQEEGAQRPL